MIAEIAVRTILPVPALIGREGKPAARRFLEFFTVNIRNPNARTAHARAAGAHGEATSRLLAHAQKKRWWLRLHENGKVNEMTCHHKLETYLDASIGCHTFHATGITDYLTNGCKLEIGQRMAGHANAKITGLYDRRNEDISISEVERVGI